MSASLQQPPQQTRQSGPVILFDGECALCNWWVDFVLRVDRNRRFRFRTLQPEDLPDADSVALQTGDEVYFRSEAVLRILTGLGFPYSLAAALRIFPRGLRDLVYNWVARNRYRWFGRRDTCRIPTPEERSRFVS
jgi:predicted DCC family thiol-disulfide oxidoreductase YuxK